VARWTLLSHSRPLFSIACSLFYPNQGSEVPMQDRLFRITSLQTLFSNPSYSIVNPYRPSRPSVLTVFPVSSLYPGTSSILRSAQALSPLSTAFTPNRPLTPLSTVFTQHAGVASRTTLREHR